MTSKTQNMGNAQNENNNKSNQQSVICAAWMRILAAVILLATAMPAMAQFQFGVMGGVTLDKGSMGSDVMDSGNRIGYCTGVVMDVNIPILGLRVETGMKYTHRDQQIADRHETYKNHYIDIPVHARYRLSVPVVGKIIAPFAFTGPSFSILFKGDQPTCKENSKTAMSWDAGAGADLFKHVRLSACYSIGVTKGMKCVDANTGNKSRSKDNCWTISAAYMF